MVSRRQFFQSIPFLGAVGFAGCLSKKKSDRPDLSGRKAKVLASTSMIADIVKNVGKDCVECECLMGPTIDPHRYEPKPTDFSRINNADLVLFNGLHLEGKMVEVFEGRKHWCLAVAEGLEGLRAAEEGFEGTHDPHVWFDVRLWMKVVDRVRDKLIELDPAQTATYLTQAATYLKELTELDKSCRESIAKIPAKRRVLITAHDAFGYFGAAYGLKVYGLQGVSTASSPSSKNVTDLAEVIGQSGVPAIFTETTVSDRGLESVRFAVKSRYPNHEFRLAAAPLYSDALGEPGTPGETYIGMVQHNVNIIVAELIR